MISLTIDGKNVKTEKGATILQVARQNNIDIPTLCHHDALEPSGACRLCTVEVIIRKKKRFVTACNYSVKEGIEIRTSSDEVLEVRKMILELLLARCPNVKIIQDLAKSYGIKKPRFKLEDENCTLCGLCIRVCQEIIGASAITLVNRGTDTKIDTPFHLSSENCIGCGACEVICPTGAIQLDYTKDTVEIKPFNTVLQLKKCQSCGKAIAPEPFVSFLNRKLTYFNTLPALCDKCKKEKESLALAENARFSQNV